MRSIIVFYIVTIIISTFIGFLLVYFSGLTAHPKKRGEKKEVDLSTYTVEDSLEKSIFEEVKTILGPSQRSLELTKKISQVFKKELEEKINYTKEELSKKYETIVEEKTRNEEIAWKKYKEILSDKKETEAVIRSVAEGLVVLDAKGNVIMINPAAERLLGISSKEKVGKPLLEGIKEEQLISLVRGTEENKEIELISPNEETKKILRASSAVIEDENGKPIGMVSVLSDITKQKELDRLKSNFVSNVTHELRTPLVAMEKSISLLLTQDIPEPQQREFLAITQRNLKRLTLLINDLLDLSKLEAGKMQITRQPSSIVNIINEAILGLETWAKTKSLTINKIIEDDLPQINVDPNRILQVLNNLIGNAIKFTPSGGSITVEAHFIRENNEVEVSIQDTGIGISKEDLPKIFDKFFQVGERAYTDIGGTGIGLSIAKEIIQLHKGRIWAESEKGKGAKFIFCLPLE
ncbi:MAG: cell wall metabolism sensor histidine kinase WalK [Candidatus Omnitrophica bacterium]|nr:cell wall metabolism sensor histidine kinase WalK [Candidatus Omnitrophota bacterium]